MSAQPGLATPPPTVPSASETALPIILPVVPLELQGPIPPPPTFGELAPVYLMDRVLSSRGIHPTVLEVLLEIVSAPGPGLS